MSITPTPTVSALQARIATQAEHQAKALEGVEPIGYIAWRDGKPAWSEDCVCEDAVFPRDIEDDCTSMAIYPATTVSALQARIAELEQDAVRGEPVGFMMVPVEPTPDMLEAGAGTKYEKRARNVWRDMIAAAAPKGTT